MGACTLNAPRPSEHPPASFLKKVVSTFNIRRTCSTICPFRVQYRQTEMKHNIQNKQVDNSSQPGPKIKTTTRVRVFQSARFGYTGANGNEAHQIQNKQVGNSSLYQTKPKTTRLQKGFTYLQSMDFQREPQSKHHLYCEQEKPAHCHGSLLLRLGTHQIQNRTRDAHKISPHGTITKRTPAMSWDRAVSWGGGLG